MNSNYYFLLLFAVVFAIVGQSYGLIFADNATTFNRNIMDFNQSFSETKLSAPPLKSNLSFMASIPPLNETKLENQREYTENHTHLSGPDVLSSNQIIKGPDPNTQVRISNSSLHALTLSNNEDIVFKIKNVTTNPMFTDVIDEPSVANNGKNTSVYVGNWYGRTSFDNGTTWNSNININPWNNMDDFCCDQDVIYNSNYKMFLLYKQGKENSNGENRFVLKTSLDGGKNWNDYPFKPTAFGSPDQFKGTWFDYPQMTTSKNYLFITSNVFSADTPMGAIVMRFSLSDLSHGGQISYSSYFSSIYNIAPIQGTAGSDTMFWAAHISNSIMRIWEWPELSAVHFVDKEIDAWSKALRGQMHCTDPAGFNWCARADSRILGGFLTGDKVVFLWNAKEGHGFQYPYVDGAVFTKTDLNYSGKLYFWNPNYAIMYGYAIPNKIGDVGLSFAYGGGKYYPSIAIGTYDNFSNSYNRDNNSSSLKIIQLVNGTSSPRSDDWGDFIRVRSNGGDGLAWISSGFTVKNDEAIVQPFYITFGHPKDLQNIFP